PPRAMLHRQGNFVTGFFPEDVQAALDEAVGVFALPAWEGGFDGVPMLGGGDLAALFAPDDDEAIQVMKSITSEGFGAERALAGGALRALVAPDDDAATQVIEFGPSEGFGAEWAQAGGWLSPHQTFYSSQYAAETTRGVAEIASSAEVFRFDGSDLMPGPVGGGSFWTAMVEWVNGDKTSQEAC